MWATVHLTRNVEQSERIVQNLEVQKIQTVLDTVQATIVNLRLHDEEIPWCIQRSGLDNRSLEQMFVTWWRHFKAIQIKSAHLQRLGSVPWWKGLRTSSDSTGTRNGSNWIFHWDPGIQWSPWYRRRTGGICVEKFMRSIQLSRSLKKYIRCLQKRAYSRLSSKAGSSSCRCTTISMGGKTKMKKYANETRYVSEPLRKTSNHVDSLSSVTTLVWDLGSQHDGEMKLFSGNYDAKFRYEWTCCVLVLNATVKTYVRKKGRWNASHALHRGPKSCGNATEDRRCRQQAEHSQSRSNLVHQHRHSWHSRS